MPKTILAALGNAIIIFGSISRNKTKPIDITIEEIVCPFSLPKISIKVGVAIVVAIVLKTVKAMK